MIKRKSIAFKLIVYILISCSALFLGIFWYNYLFSKKIITENISENAKNLTRATVNEIDSILYRIQKVPEVVAAALERGSFDKDELMNMLYAAIESNPEIYGGTISFEPYVFDSELLYFAPYYYKKDGKMELTYLGGESYQYFYLDWYQIPKELKKPAWSEPYYDEGGGNILMATYSVPFYREVDRQRKFMGVVTADVSLIWLQEMIASIKIAKSGYGFLISKNGTFVTHPYNKLIMNETIFSAAEESNNGQLREIGRSMVKGKSDFVPFISMVNEKNSWLSYAPLASSGWSLGVIFPRGELLSDINRLNRVVLLLGFFGSVILFIILLFIAVSITRPIKILADTTRGIGKGNFDFDLCGIKSRDEVGMLAESFVYMRDSLKKYIRDLTETTAVKERMQSELRIAHDIQMGIVPKIFPPFPDRPEFDIYAILEPAKEVGGDFYDFFFMDDEKFCFVVGDVSGKGVPASLLMAITKTLIKTMSKGAAGPNEILSRVNKEIAHDNESSMFITIACGILNMKTGELLYSSGGHPMPLVIRSGGDCDFLKSDTDIVVGIKEDAVYRNNKTYLSPGDVICLYTDGITEAMNKKDELFDEARLKETVDGARGGSIREIVLDIRSKIKEFSEGMPQADDITLLVIKYSGVNEGRKM
ncbi:MAG: SpoIIE family protein phosphatase [bacterium]|nr:SpoIIE family protein phosphatase [bacterium]